VIRASVRAASLASLLLAAGCNGPVATSDAQVDAAARVVTLAPHLAELVFDIGAGDSLVGVSAYTDYPEAASALPVVGDAFVVDREQLAILRPDLLLAWQSGTPPHVVEQLREAGYRVETIETRGIEDVAGALHSIGELLGRQAAADRSANRYRAGLESLRADNRDREPIRVFYQVSQRPLYTVNGKHYISELLELCGGVNVFADIGELAPLVDVEAVIDSDPEVMLAGGDVGDETFSAWDRWPEMTANRYANRFHMPASEIGRATTRLVSAGEAVCDALQQARRNRRAALGQSGDN